MRRFAYQTFASLALQCTAVPAVVCQPWRAAPPNSPATNRAIPSLDDLAGTWQQASDLLSFPALNSMHGSAQSTNDLLSLTNVNFPPITMSRETGSLLVNDKPPALDQVRWYPYQVLRKGHSGDLQIETAVRMPFEQNGLLFHIRVTNSAAAPATFELKINLSATTALHDHWGWKVPRDDQAGRFSAVASDAGASMTLRDSQGKLSNCFSFTQKPDGLTVQGDSGQAAPRKITCIPAQSIPRSRLCSRHRRARKRRPQTRPPNGQSDFPNSSSRFKRIGRTDSTRCSRPPILSSPAICRRW